MPVESLNIYDYPQYLDLLFAEETEREALFIEQACRRYSGRTPRRLLEPGCGGGRLIVELARRGYQVSGFDSSQPALAFLRRELKQRRLTAATFVGDLASFRVPLRVDAAYCTFNTFRHLLTEPSAISHLRHVARAVRRGGLYILGLHVLPLDVDEHCVERWTARHHGLTVTVTLRVLSTCRRRRLEQIRLSMLVRRGSAECRFRTEFPLRMYTARQLRALFRQVPEWELCDVFDFWYEIDHPLKLDDQITDTVLVLRKR